MKPWCLSWTIHIALRPGNPGDTRPEMTDAGFRPVEGVRPRRGGRRRRVGLGACLRVVRRGVEPGRRVETRGRTDRHVPRENRNSLLCVFHTSHYREQSRDYPLKCLLPPKFSPKLLTHPQVVPQVSRPLPVKLIFVSPSFISSFPLLTLSEHVSRTVPPHLPLSEKPEAHSPVPEWSHSQSPRSLPVSSNRHLPVRAVRFPLAR